MKRPPIGMMSAAMMSALGLSLINCVIVPGVELQNSHFS
jgi:hypothetical protein